MEAKRKILKSPIVVDLEQGLLKGGLFWEGLWALIRQTPLNLFKTVYWAAKGQLHTKIGHILNSRSAYPPVRQEMIEVIRKKRQDGHPVILRHTRHRELARTIQYRYGCFSDLTSHLPQRLVQDGFIYLAERGDAALWEKAHGAIIFNSSGASKADASDFKWGIEEVQINQRSLFGSIVKALRPHQWVKSFLIFLPIIASFRFMEAALWLTGFKTFLAFAFVSSSTYVLNDLFDLEADRQHPSNKHRPFASGDLPLYWGAFLYVSLLAAGLLGAFMVSQGTGFALLGYAGISMAYTFFLKRMYLVDTFVLASLYVYRVITGCIALDIFLSPWLLNFCGFFFLSLAFLKRVIELGMTKNGSGQSIARRGYFSEDRLVLMGFGVASAFMTSLIYMLYMQFNNKSHSIWLWSLGMLTLFWLCRIWLLAWRGRVTTDPVKFALKDWVSYGFLLLCSICWIVAGK